MPEKKPFATLTWFAVLALCISLGGAGIALWTSQNLSQQHQSEGLPPTQPDAPRPGQAQVYWLAPPSAEPSAIAFVPRNLAGPGQSPDIQLTQALNALLAEAVPDNASTAIPPNTRLLGVSQTPRGIEIDLSREFTEGGGSSSMVARLGQVLYTASSLDPNQPIWLMVEGSPLTVLGGEGLMIDQPLTRAQFAADFAATPE